MFGGSLTIAGVQSFALIAIGAVVVTLVHGHDSEIARSTYLFLLFIPLNLLTLYAAGILNGLHRFTAYHSLRFVVIALMADALLRGRLDTRRCQRRWQRRPRCLELHGWHGKRAFGQV